MRLDVYLAENGIVKSRELAKRLISAGAVEINGKTVTKPAFNVSDTDNINITGEMPKYVGRGGYKLEKAIECFGIELRGLVCIDIGASTGGFTDCMLQNGAGYVYAVDVGHGQLDGKLLADSRICSMEGTNIKDVRAEDLLRKISFAATDVSFISLSKIMPKISELLEDNGSAVMLIKPQFECGKADIGKNGIVRSPKVHARVMREIHAACTACGMGVVGMDFSPIQGGDGNIEYLMYAVKGAAGKIFDFDKIAADAQKSFNERR